MSFFIWRVNLDTIKFEAVKTAFRQSKDGYTLSLAIHPDDISEQLMRDFVGSCYMVVMVRLDEENKPVEKKNDPIVSQAGMLCRDPKFWEFIYLRTGDEVHNESECAEWFKFNFGIDSRADLKTDIQAREIFIKFKQEFNAWKNKNE